MHGRTSAGNSLRGTPVAPALRPAAEHAAAHAAGTLRGRFDRAAPAGLKCSDFFDL